MDFDTDAEMGGAALIPFFLIFGGSISIGIFGMVSLAAYIQFKNDVFATILPVTDYWVQCYRASDTGCAEYQHMYQLTYSASPDLYARPGEYSELFTYFGGEDCPMNVCAPNATLAAHVYPCALLPYSGADCGVGMRFYSGVIYNFLPIANIALYIFGLILLLAACVPILYVCARTVVECCCRRRKYTSIVDP